MSNPFGALIPATLPDQLAAVVKELRTLTDVVNRIASQIDAAAKPPPPAAEPRWESLPHSPPMRADIIGMILSGDTAGVYSVQIGNDVVFSVDLGVNVPVVLDLAGAKHLAVYQGLPVTLNVPNGAVAHGTIIYQARDRS